MTTITPQTLPMPIPGEVRRITTDDVAAGTATDAEMQAWRVDIMRERIGRLTAALDDPATPAERMAYHALSVASWSLVIAREAVEADGGEFGTKHQRINDAGAVVAMAMDPDEQDGVTLTWGHVVREREARA